MMDLSESDEHKVINLGLVIGQLSFGGAEKQLYELVTRLDRKRFNPVVFCLSESEIPYGEKIRKRNIKVHILKRRSHFDVIRLLRLVYLFRKERIDVVHSKLFISVAYSYLACKLAGIKRFIPSIGGYTYRKSSLVRMVEIAALNSADKIMTNSVDLRDYVAENMNTDPDKFVIIHNGIEANLFNNPTSADLIKKDIGIKQDHSVVGIISRDSAVKNIPLFLDAAKSLLQKRDNVCFVLVGCGLDNGKKEEWLGDFPLKDSFVFLGTREDIPDLLGVLDVFVLTSISEGLPNTIMEAMAAGIPIVATNVGGCSELVVNGKNGLLVPSNNKNELVKAIETILDDKDMAVAMGDTGRKFIEEKFSMEKMVKKTEDILSSVWVNR